MIYSKKKEVSKKTFVFDVMLDGRFVCTLKINIVRSSR